MTRARLVGALFAIVVLALGYWIMTHTHWVEHKIPMPLKGEALEDPYYAARILARQLGAQAQTVQRVDSMPPLHGTLVLSSEFWNLFPQTGEQLQTWVRAGGHLVLDAKLLGGDHLEWLEVERVWPEEEQQQEEQQQQENGARADQGPPRHATQDGRPRDHCFALQVSEPGANPAVRDAPAKLCGGLYSYLDSNVQPEWSLESEIGPQAIRHTLGRGKVTIFNNPETMTQRGPLNLAHAWYFVLVTDLKASDTIWFAPFEDSPSLLTLMWQHGAAVITVALMALVGVLWRAAPRFGPLMAQPLSTRRSLRDQILGSGAFAARSRGGEILLKAQYRALERNARRRIVGYDALSPQERIAIVAKACDMDAAVLARAMAPESSRAMTLAHRLITLETARRRLTTHSLPLRSHT